MTLFCFSVAFDPKGVVFLNAIETSKLSDGSSKYCLAILGDNLVAGSCFKQHFTFSFSYSFSPCQYFLLDFYHAVS